MQERFLQSYHALGATRKSKPKNQQGIRRKVI